MRDTILKCDYEMESDLELTDVSLELEQITEARPMQPLELVEPARVELAWPVLRAQVPSRPVAGQLWMGNPRVTPRQRRMRRRSRTGVVKFVCAFLALFVAHS